MRRAARTCGGDRLLPRIRGAPPPRKHQPWRRCAGKPRVRWDRSFPLQNAGLLRVREPSAAAVRVFETVPVFFPLAEGAAVVLRLPEYKVVFVGEEVVAG